MINKGEERSEERQNLHKNKISPTTPPNRYRNKQKSNIKKVKIKLPVIKKKPRNYRKKIKVSP